MISELSMHKCTQIIMCQVSVGALQQMDLDLVQCEMFASSEPVPGMEEGVLVMCFSDLR